MVVRSAVLVALACLALAAPAGARDVPLFDVGTAVVDITPTPDHPQYLGGYDQMDKPTAKAHDPLQVRAFFVGHGKHAVAFAIVDSQGWFAGYQEGAYGVTDARQSAAAAISELGYSVTAANFIVSSTHSHAAPTVMGIWGPTDPVYLKRVHDATVQALTEAARHTRKAQLWTGSGDITDIIVHNYDGTDSFDGWGIDPHLPVLWARDPKTGATEGLYANVPVHPDQFRGSKYDEASADWPGFVRARLDQLLGGTAVIADGTLGRQETIGSIDDYSEVEKQGTFITNQLLRGMTGARPITTTDLGGAEQLIAAPAHNAALLALLAANAAGPRCDLDPTGNLPCTIDRSIEPPYQTGNVIGTWVTALRIGNALWVSEPGEAFDDVTKAIRSNISGPREIHVVGMAQDQLGYYYPPEDYPQSELNPSDFILFNVSPALADENVDAAALDATQLGFQGTPAHPQMDVVDPNAFFEAGTQFYPSVAESADPDRQFLVNATPSNAPVAPGGADHTASNAIVDFGDGSPQVQLTEKEPRIDHSFPGPGTYTITSSTTDENGAKRTYSAKIVVDPPLAAVVTSDGRWSVASVDGGDGQALAAHWTFADGSTADGLRAKTAGRSGTVTVVDGAGDTATATF
jgi:hypothetical protein